ncbi:MAG TPA: STAS/SEC14 domain-containing protein [Candidatus Limnocylindrales bacterium]|nr:STAS/SEC14 domain-containing protein [Candidatus Limnocylindrales bacterium]
MIEEISGMPAGTIGLRASGKVSADDYKTVLEPVLRAVVERGEPIKLMYVLADDTDYSAGAAVQDMKTGATLGVPHLSAWRKTALVSDADWVDRVAHAFGWMMPGAFHTFATADMDAAKSWLVS